MLFVNIGVLIILAGLAWAGITDNFFVSREEVAKFWQFFHLKKNGQSIPDVLEEAASNVIACWGSRCLVALGAMVILGSMLNMAA